MIYYHDDSLTIRSMKECDLDQFIIGFKEQGWYKPYELFSNYYIEQEKNERFVIVAEKNGHVSGYVTLLPNTKVGPFAEKNIPEIIDFNVLIKYQRNGIGNKLMDITESLAKEMSDYVSLSVGLHSGYGTAQRMYVKRGYIPDGTGVWYNGKELEPYTECINDDDLTIYFLKSL